MAAPGTCTDLDSVSVAPFQKKKKKNLVPPLPHTVPKNCWGIRLENKELKSPNVCPPPGGATCTELPLETLKHRLF